MPSHRRKLLPLCIAASLISGFSTEVAAIGVGEIHLQSFLGAPLQAEIPLNHLGELGTEQLKVQLGSQDDYGAMSVDYTYLHSQLKIEPIVKNGRGYVRISTREPITEPYLNFVLNLRWPQGQLVREFTVLLDPPTQAVAATSPAATADEPRVAESVAPSRRNKAQRAASVNAPIKDAVAVEDQAPLEGGYTIQRGDSLWRIANRVKPAQASVEQVMAAILARNPNAFVNGNPNLLKEAVTITLPDAEQIATAVTSDSPSVAKAEIASTASAPIERTAASVADTAATVNSAPAVSALVEENSALKTQVSDLTGNVASLNDNLAQSEQRLHQLESQLNELIQQMQQQRAAVAAMSGNVEPSGAQLAQGTGSVITQVNAADLHSPGKAHTPWWVHLLYWLGISGAVTWAVREHFWPQRRLTLATIGGNAQRRSDDISAPMTRNAVTAPVTRINTLADAVDLSLDVEELPIPEVNAARFNEPAPQLLRNSDEPVDVSISAGVFVAFGRFSEAEQLLRDVLARDPARIDLKLQLLDVLMQSDQPGAFDDLAAEIEEEAQTPEALAELAVLRDSYRPKH